MTSARSEIFHPAESAYYHCISRCVRRAYLCGQDAYSGRSYEHRKEWIRSRLAELLEVFAFECLAYAAMSTHLHSLLRNLPEVARSWSSDEVARRWRLLFPLRRGRDGRAKEPSQAEIAGISGDGELVELYRWRLCDISWFQRCLNEYIACRANAEDGCTGSFWEGRFKCKRVEGAAALLATSVYVDLNPLRAGEDKTPEESTFTSIRQRIRRLRSGSHARNLPRLAAHKDVVDGSLSERGYIELVDEIARIPVSGKHHMPNHFPPIFKRLGFRYETWLDTVTRLPGFRRIVAPPRKLEELGCGTRRKKFQGLNAAKAAFL